VESWQRRKDGQKRLLAWWCRVLKDSRGNVTGALSSAQDITENKQAEEALKASEQNFRNSIDSSLMGIRIVDEKGRTLYTNQAFLDVFSYENNDELTKSPPEERYTPESYADWVLRYEQLLRGELIPDKVEVDIIRKDGIIRHLKVFRKEVLWGGKTQYQTLYDDITERKNAEKALMASEANFRNSMENSPMGIRIGNAEEQAFYVNSAFMDIFGYKNIEEVKTIPRYERYTPESYAHFRLMKEQESSGESIPDNLEADIVRKDGTIRHIEASRREVFWNGERHVQVIYNDITEHKEAEKKLEQAAQEWRTTFDSITDLISIQDKDNRIIRVNKALADLLQTTPQKLVGKFCREVMRGDQECPVNCPHLLAIKTGKSSSVETFNSKLGIHFQESASPIFNEKGEATGSVVVARDVTKQKRMEEQLILTDRLASIGELSSGIAHELNNPLTSVIGFSQLLMEGEVPEDIKKDLGIVYSEAQRAATIVKNLLTFARKHAPVKQLSQVNTVIEDVLRLRAYEQKVNNIEIENRLAPNLPEIMIDHFQMQQVFLNIMVNGEFAMLEAHHRGKMVITTERLDGVIRITFTDDGPGISEENLKHIFDPFFTTKEVGKGTGLGLSICHGIVMEHGGKIYARSEKGMGTSFIVELPLINEQ
jgi:PAS domain S-box-containing protein